MGYKTVYTIIISFLKASEANEHNPEKHESRFNVLFLLLVVIMRFQGVENFNNKVYFLWQPFEYEIEVFTKTNLCIYRCPMQIAYLYVVLPFILKNVSINSDWYFNNVKIWQFITTKRACTTGT